MPLSRDLSTYRDIRETLDAAKKLGGAKFHLGTKGEAIRWRMRAYMLRKLLSQEYAKDVADRGYIAPTEYDTLRIDLAEVDGAWELTLRFDKTTPKLIPLGGASPEPKADDEVDPLLGEARRIAIDLGIDVEN